MTIVECARHGFPFGRKNAGSVPGRYYVRRCAHLGNRFIVEIRSNRPASQYAILDYVEDATPGGAEIIEAYDTMTDEQADATWARLYARMTSGVGPEEVDA
jgi:hypothetical protein